LMMALAAGKPVGILSIPPLNLSSYMYVGDGLGVLIRNDIELVNYLSEIAKNSGKSMHPDPKRFTKMVGPFDGCATQRIAESILLLAGGEV